jgi:DNA-3-methyladenine glycosylase
VTGRRRTLSRAFYRRPSVELAPELLGKLVVHGDRAGRIVEVEAYRRDDPASHAFAGPTRRNATMFGPPGHLYVYFSYGVHWCANVVCGAQDGQAVLLRALAPVDGLDAMRAARPAARRDRDLASGPGRLTQALGIDVAFDGADLVRGPIRLVDDGTSPPTRPGVSARIGISKAVDQPWRWFVPGDPNVSRLVRDGAASEVLSSTSAPARRGSPPPPAPPSARPATS